jgi:nitrate reductase assembly molybdenum cofactor insertion protein NarJ
MTAHLAVDPHATEVLREAALWRALGRLFECPDDHWRADISSLTRELDVPALRTAAAAIDDSVTPGQYFSVFGPGGPAPPREASYHESLELGSLMSELAGYYHAFAYAPGHTEPLDHVAVELNFVSYLKLKEAYAYAQGHDERAEVAARAAARFISEHLTRIATPLAALLADSHLPYLAHASALLAAKVGARPVTSRLPMLHTPPSDDDDGDVECGMP